MKLKILLLCLFMISGIQAQAKAKARGKARGPRYPVARLVSGSVFLLNESLTLEDRAAKLEEKQKSIRSGTVLKDKASLRVGEKSSIDLTLAAGARLVVLENSEVEIPGIAWEDGTILEIHLKKGKIRYECSTDCNRKIVTDLYEDILPPGDFIISYNPAVPLVEMAVLAGKIDFKGLENEAAVKLTGGQKAKFVGVLEAGEPAFDVLLQGRKVARGQASEMQPLEATEIEFWKKRDEVVKKEAAKVAKAQVVQRKPSQICSAPLGELNQCAWQCEKNIKGAKDCAVARGAVCARTRCNANGAWADRAELPSSNNKCGLKTVVDICDY